MACVKLGSKADTFHRQGQAWLCTTGLPSDVVVHVGEMSFHLHKFPLLSRSGVLGRLISEAAAAEKGGENDCVISLPDTPGGAKTFESVAKFCYGVKIDLTPSTVVPLRCAAELLEMTEDFGHDNLVVHTETFLAHVLETWTDSLRALQSCGVEGVLPHADALSLPARCIDSLAAKACTPPTALDDGATPFQSPGGGLLWNGISTGARPRHPSPGWWYEDVCLLTFSLYRRLLSAVDSHGVRPEVMAGSLALYAKSYIPGLTRRGPRLLTGPAAPEDDQRMLLEEIDRLLPLRKGLVPARFLFRLLRAAAALGAAPACRSNLERRAGLQLHEAALDDLLVPSSSPSTEALYDVDFVQRVLEHFLESEGASPGVSPFPEDESRLGRSVGPATLTPITSVAKLVDGYLAEVAPDPDLKLSKFQALASAVPDFARPLDDGLYHAIDLYLKGHEWMSEKEREGLCAAMDCRRLSLEACTHAAQNERLPLRVVVQVLFFEQLHLRTSIAACFMASEDGFRPPVSGVTESSDRGGGWVAAVKENQVLKAGMEKMKARVVELEQECSSMRREIERLGRGGGGTRRWGRLGLRMRSQMCSAGKSMVGGGQDRGNKKNSHD